MRRIYLLLALVASLFVTPALADFTGKDASLATITFKNPGACASVVCVPVFQLYDGTNVVALTTSGGDGVSNTLTGLPTYDRMLIYNGTTWDRWQGAIKAAANAYAAGSLAIGSGVDGWNITEGVTTDAAATAGGTGTQSAKLRLMTTQLNSLALNQSSQITQETATAGALGTTADTAWTSGVGTVVAILKNIAGGIASIVTNTGASIPAGTNIVGKVGIDQTTDGTTNGVRLTSRYPAGATPITASATGTTAATTATLAGAVAKTTYICSLSVRANATANTNVTDTVTGVISGTLSRALWVPANTAGLGVDEQIYDPCLPASATNTAIAVVSGAPGTGGVVTVNATGYQQ